MNQLPDKNDDTLKKLLGKEMLEQPSDQFTASVMNKLGIVPAPVAIRYDPVISPLGWFFITLFSAILFYLALSGSTTASFSSKAFQVQSALQQTTSIFGEIFSGSFALLLTVAAMAVFLLFGAESLYRQTRHRTA